jgi:3-phosphoshikimate 1-carboxyvinyltransferase
VDDSIEIRSSGPVDAEIRPPGSKSITNRALICAALADGPSILDGALDSQDTRVLIDALGTLGIETQHDRANCSIRVDGRGGRIPASDADLYVANSGTSVRFMSSMVTLGRGTFRLAGTERMHQRPIQDLLDALAQLGADAKSEMGSGCPPVVVRANGLEGGTASVSGQISSQFLSGLLMAAPLAGRPVELDVAGELVSKPYVQMTLAVMRAFGVSVDAGDLTRFVIPSPVVYRPCRYDIEPDASAASYFFAAAAVTGGRVTVQGLSRRSLQGDVGFCECLARMGCEVHYGEDSITVIGKRLSGIDVDMNAISDTVQTLGAVALFADGPTTVTGVAHIRHKETDRIGDLATELRKLGARVDERRDGLRITPGMLHGATIDTYDDHRMAMSLAVAGLALEGVVIRDPGCTAKTYPRFFDDLRKVARKI